MYNSLVVNTYCKEHCIDGSKCTLADLALHLVQRHCVRFGFTSSTKALCQIWLYILYKGTMADLALHLVQRQCVRFWLYILYKDTVSDLALHLVQRECGRFGFTPCTKALCQIWLYILYKGNMADLALHLVQRHCARFGFTSCTKALCQIWLYILYKGAVSDLALHLVQILTDLLHKPVTDSVICLIHLDQTKHCIIQISNLWNVNVMVHNWDVTYKVSTVYVCVCLFSI